MTAHIQEGMALNQKRQKLYEILSQGRSRSVSTSLILYEKISLKFIASFNIESRLTKQAKSRGISFLCEEFSMTHNSGLVSWQVIHTPIQTVSLKFIPFLMWTFQKELYNQNLKGFYKKVLSEIRYLEQEPRLNCLLRHVLESMARVAWLGLKDPARADLSVKLLSVMNLSLVGSRHVDLIAEDLQREGLPILCHDLPLIKFSD